MAHEEARFEYRAFAPGFGIVERRLRAAGGQPQIRESEDLYFVGRLDDTHNVKIRDGHLEIKVLVEARDGLEQWNPLVRLAFPVSDAMLAETLCPALRIPARLPAGAGQSATRLAEVLGAGRTDVVVVDVFKRRYGFMVADCIAEHVEVTINGAALQTACVESVDPRLVREVAARLGLDAYPNTSYPAALRRVTGLAREPIF